jgi:hypothetical protein
MLFPEGAKRATSMISSMVLLGTSRGKKLRHEIRPFNNSSAIAATLTSGIDAPVLEVGVGEFTR